MKCSYQCLPQHHRFLCRRVRSSSILARRPKVITPPSSLAPTSSISIAKTYIYTYTPYEYYGCPGRTCHSPSSTGWMCSSRRACCVARASIPCTVLYGTRISTKHYAVLCVCVCVCVCVFIKLHITAQSGPVILVILRYSH